MATESFELTCELDAPPKDVYHAWMNGKLHSDFTGAPATVEPRVGGPFTAWEGYIDGINIDLEPDRRIVQEWRTQEFPPDGPPSRLEIVLEPVDPGRTLLRLIHTEIPEGQGERYRQGWEDNYFGPMRKYFAPKAAPAAAPAEEREEAPARPAAAARPRAEERPAARKPAAKKAAAAKKPAARKPAAKKAAAKRPAAKKKPAARRAGGAKKKAPARRTSPRKAPARKPAARKASARKAPARKPAARKSSARKAPARKGSARKAPARRGAARRGGRR